MQQKWTYLSNETLDTMEHLEFIARGLVEGGMLGLHRSPFRGYSPEFSEYKKYTPGDNVKYMDWKVLARNDRYFVKCFEEETNMSASILVDTSASMAMPDSQGRPTKFRMACCMAAAFLYLMHRQRDAFSLMTWDSQVGVCTDYSNSARHFMQCLKELETRVPQGQSDTGACLEKLAELIPRRSVVLVFSDFLDKKQGFFQPLNRLVFNSCEVILFQVLNQDELNFPYQGVVRFRDMESGEIIELDAENWQGRYLARLNEYNRVLRDFCDAKRISLEPVSTHIPFERALAAYFMHRAKLNR